MKERFIRNDLFETTLTEELDKAVITRFGKKCSHNLKTIFGVLN